MAAQDITLRTASPATDIVLRAVGSVVVASTIIYLTTLAPSPTDIVLRDTTAVAGGGAPAVTGTLTLSAEAFAVAAATLGISGALALASEAYSAATGSGGISATARAGRLVQRASRTVVAGPQHSVFHRAPRGAVTLSRLRR